MSNVAQPVTIAPATGPEDLAEVKRLFLTYAQSLDFSLCFQGFDAELDGLPGKYAVESRGALLLARSGGDAVGVVGLRPLEPEICEMKRLYVEPAARSLRLGATLAEAIIAAARLLGYRRMRLDTLQRMEAANRLYDRLGFRDIPPYYDNPLPDVRYRELVL